MSIPEEIQDAINEGIICPICKKAYIGLVPTQLYYEIRCSNCYKNLVIRYTEKPFKIVKIEEI